MEVRTASADDVAGIRRVADRSWHAAHDGIVGASTVDEFVAEHYDPESVREAVAGDGCFLVGDDGGRTVGFAAANRSESDPGTFALGAIYVDPDRWGEGVGSRLLDRVAADVAARGGERLRLVVLAGNDRAVAFYEARGFERVDDRYDENLDARGLVYAKEL